MSYDIQQKDLQSIWHPLSQMKDYEHFKPAVIHSANDCYIQLKNGKTLIDAIASWWCKTLGHNHPEIKHAVTTQMNYFEHVSFANTTNETIVKLSNKLTGIAPHLKKVFYASDGACAVEIALKMSLCARKMSGDIKRKKVISLQNSYHGETLGALSVSDLSLYKEPYAPFLFDTHFIKPAYVTSCDSPLWENCDSFWQKTKKVLEPFRHTATAIIVEPIIQGANNMQLYSPDFLQRLYYWAKANNVHIIADEIMTGIARTGKMLACEHADIQADFVCLGKGLTSGWMALSAVLTRNEIYDIFYDDHENNKAFMHSHTYSGNPLAASAALATLDIIEKNNFCEKAVSLQHRMMTRLKKIADNTGLLKNLRGIGAIVAADLVGEQHRYGYKVYQRAMELGALLRPIGNTVYWLPPLTITDETLDELMLITQQAIISAGT